MKQLENLDLNDVTIMSENEMKQVNGGNYFGYVDNDSRDLADSGSFSCTCKNGNKFMGAGTSEDLEWNCVYYCDSVKNCTCS